MALQEQDTPLHRGHWAVKQVQLMHQALLTHQPAVQVQQCTQYGTTTHTH